MSEEEWSGEVFSVSVGIWVVEILYGSLMADLSVRLFSFPI